MISGICGSFFYLLPTNAVAVTNLQLFDVEGWVLSVAGCFHVIVSLE